MLYPACLYRCALWMGPSLQSLSRIPESCLGFWYIAQCSLGFTSENFSSVSQGSLGFQHLPQCSLELSLQGSRTPKKRPYCLSHGRQEDRGRVGGLGTGGWGHPLQRHSPSPPASFACHLLYLHLCQVTQSTPVDGTTQPMFLPRAVTSTWTLGRQPGLIVGLVSS